MNPVLGPDIAHMAQLWERNEWNALREAEEEQPPPDRAVKGSDALQCCHFGAFFTAAHGTRHPLSPTQRMGVTVQIVLHCLRRWATEGIWLHLRRTLRARVLMRNRIRMHRSSSSRQRTETLEGWLTYWQDAEAEAHRGLQRMQSIRLVGNSGAEWASQMAQAQVMTSTCEEVKLQVLWELYWLLLIQTSRKRHAYWLRWQTLQRQRQTLHWQLAASSDTKSPLDFWNNEPVSLRAVNAALFVMALQPPRFRYRPGKEVTLTQLLLLANAPQPMCHVSEGDLWLRHVSGVVAAFIDSSLCDDSAWLRKRFAMSVPLIPRRTWRPPTTTPRSGGGEPLDRCEGDKPPSVRSMEERSSSLRQRRPGSLPSIDSGRSSRGASPVLHRHMSQSPRASSVVQERAPSVERSLPAIPRTGSSPDLPAAASPRQPSTPVRQNSSHLGSLKPILRVPPLRIGAAPAPPGDAGPRRHAIVGPIGNNSNQIPEPLPKSVTLPPLRN
eukprot:GGOE01009912.1.p1 GENE.GGOE01009912.1~~GGOE01009912.1.p1  ORF type:complete len:507 (-),score=90.39 GGOE01009912.1:853-2340(-)